MHTTGTPGRFRVVFLMAVGVLSLLALLILGALGSSLLLGVLVFVIGALAARIMPEEWSWPPLSSVWRPLVAIAAVAILLGAGYAILSGTLVRPLDLHEHYVPEDYRATIEFAGSQGYVIHRELRAKPCDLCGDASFTAQLPILCEDAITVLPEPENLFIASLEFSPLEGLEASGQALVAPHVGDDVEADYLLLNAPRGSFLYVKGQGDISSNPEGNEESASWTSETLDAEVSVALMREPYYYARVFIAPVATLPDAMQTLARSLSWVFLGLAGVVTEKLLKEPLKALLGRLGKKESEDDYEVGR